MSVLAGLVGDLSSGLKAAWVLWLIWIAGQLLWLRRARVDASSSAAASHSRMTGRSPLSIAVRPDRVRVPPSPAVSGAVTSPSVPVTVPMPAPSAVAGESSLRLEEMSASAEVSEPAAAQAAESEAPRPKRRRRAPRAQTADVMSAV